MSRDGDGVIGEQPTAGESATVGEPGIRVLIVDDQQLVRAGFHTILDSEPGIDVIGEAADGAAAIATANALHPDVICMDVQMPGMDGLEATRRITTTPDLTCAVLMLTTFDREDYLFASLRAGASGFVLKNSPPERLIEAVRVLARGDALLSPEVTRRVIALASGESDVPEGGRSGAGAPDAGRLDAGGLDAERSTRPEASTALETLTEREHEVLTLLAQGKSNAEIAGALYLGEATVKTHVSKVLMKLGIRDRVHAVVYAYEHGIATPGS